MAAEAACEPVSRWENAAMRLWLAVGRRQSVLASRPGRCRVLLVSYSLFGYVLVFVFVCGWYTSVPFIHFLDSYFSIHYAVICGRLYYVLFFKRRTG